MDHRLINLLHLFKIIFIGILFKMKKMKKDEKISIDITIVTEIIVFILSIGILLYEFHPWKKLSPKIRHIRPIILSIVLFLIIELILSLNRTSIIEII